MFTIAVDVMGGDLGPRVAFKACKKLLRQQSDLQFILALTAEFEVEAQHYFSRYSSRITLIVCECCVSMHDAPAQTLRSNKKSTMAVAIEQVKAGRAQGLLSVGNTGALMVLARSILGTLHCISRPALATQLNTRGKPLLMLDLGANLSSDAEQLCEFAHLGIAWCKARGSHSPKVALLNIGREECKGTEEVRSAGQSLCLQMPAYYRGYCEGDDIYSGHLDVIVCDGFSGNVVVKTSEGLAGWFSQEMSMAFSGSRWSWLFGPIWNILINSIRKRFTATRYGGALLLGVNGIVVKTHGKSDDAAFFAALAYLIKQIRRVDLNVLSAELVRLKPDKEG